MALFDNGGSDLEKQIPPQRVSAFANLDLGKFVENNPVSLPSVDALNWNVTYGDEAIEADAVIEVPVSLIFEIGDLSNDMTADDLKVVKLKLNGEEMLAKQIEDAHIPFDPLSTIDVARIEAQARKERGL